MQAMEKTQAVEFGLPTKEIQQFLKIAKVGRELALAVVNIFQVENELVLSCHGRQLTLANRFPFHGKSFLPVSFSLKDLLEITRAEKSDYLFFSIENTNLVLTTGSGRQLVKGFESPHYFLPVAPKGFKLQTEILSESFPHALKIIDHESIRNYGTCALIEVTENAFQVVATDGFRLVKSSFHAFPDSARKLHGRLIPANGVELILKMASLGSELEFSVFEEDSTRLSVSTRNITAEIRLSGIKYPHYAAIFPALMQFGFRFNRLSLLDTLKKVKTTTDKSRQFYITSRCVFRSRQSEVHEYSEYFPALSEDICIPFGMTLNCQFLIDALSASKVTHGELFLGKTAEDFVKLVLGSTEVLIVPIKESK